MRIKWENIFGVMLFVFCIYLFFKVKPYFDHLLEGMLNSYYYNYNPVVKVAVFGLICVTIVAVIKMILDRK